MPFSFEENGYQEGNILRCVFLYFSLKSSVVKFHKESVSGCWADVKLLYNLLYWTDPTWCDSNCINYKQVSNVSILANLSFLHQLSLKLVVTKCLKNWWTAIKTFNLVRNLLITITIQYAQIWWKLHHWERKIFLISFTHYYH